MDKDQYWVYGLVSEIQHRIYVGLSDNPKKRVKSHNKGDTKSTKGYRPWILFYREFIGKLEDARQREKYLKSGSGKEFLKKELKRLRHIPE